MLTSRRVLTGAFFIIAPWFLLVGTLCAYAITGFVISAMISARPCDEVFYIPDQNTLIERTNVEYHEPVYYPPVQDIRIECESGDTTVVVGNLIRIALGALGMVGVVGILVGNPFGLYLLFSAMTEDRKKVGKK